LLRALTIVLIFFCSGGYAQIQGDSVRIETMYSKNYIGTISKIDKEGYFIKVNNLREIFIPLTEIKFINKINTELEQKALEPKPNSVINTPLIDSTDAKPAVTNVIKETPEIEHFSAPTSTIEISEFYKKYDLANFEINSFDSPETIGHVRLFQIKLNKHIRKNKSLSLKDRRRFGKNLISEMSVNPNDEFLKYQKSKRLGSRIMIIGLVSFTTGNIITFQSFFSTFTGLGIGGVVLTEIGAIVMGTSSKWLFKSFYRYLEEQQSW
tara:strand:+ start:539 stop:1336 length:798 start_codon:yes stop_codon:yes gene_type:complete